MLFSYLLKGLVIGFSLALPVGPIALLCIRRTLARGPAAGVVSGMGAATADGVYGLIAGFGITFISNFLFSHQYYSASHRGLRALLSRRQDIPHRAGGVMPTQAWKTGWSMITFRRCYSLLQIL